MFRFKKSRPWTKDPQYTTVALQERDDYRTDGHGRAKIFPKAEKPVYIELGRNILKLIVNPEISTVENLTAQDNEAKVQVIPMINDGSGFIIGRETTPDLRLDVTASRRHLELVPRLASLTFTDLQSENGTIIHTPLEPIPYCRTISLGPR